MALLPRTTDCGDFCDPSYSIYGYRPSLAATIFFLVAFALSGFVHVAQNLQYRTWFYSTAMAIGCLLETLGYIAKILLWQDPFSDSGFKMSLVMLTLAPAFYSAAIYYTLKHICLRYGGSRLKPALYTYIFITCDLLSILLQAVGGGIAARADDQAALDTGDHILVAGLALQVATLVIFGALAVDYGVTIRHKDTTSLRPFLFALSVAYLAILARCAYRVAELAGGWGEDNKILRDEGLFIAFDSTMCLVATLVLNVWHTGRYLHQAAAVDSEK